MEMFVGILDKIRVINTDPLMIGFTINLPTLKLNCIAVHRETSNKILMIPDGKYELVVQGRFNRKSHFVVKQFEVLNPDDQIKKLGI